MPYVESIKVFCRVVELGFITSGGRDLRPEWPYFLGQVCNFLKLHQIYVHAAFRIAACSKHDASGVRLSCAV